MFRTASAMASAAALAAFLSFAIPALVNASTSEPGQRSDLAGLADCELRGWPYYARTCLRDESRNAGRAAKVRIVAPDRIPVAEIKAASGAAPIRLNRAASVAAATTPPSSHLTAPASWMMSYDEAKLNLAAGDFIRRTVR